MPKYEEDWGQSLFWHKRFVIWFGKWEAMYDPQHKENNKMFRHCDVCPMAAEQALKPCQQFVCEFMGAFGHITNSLKKGAHWNATIDRKSSEMLGQY